MNWLSRFYWRVIRGKCLINPKDLAFLKWQGKYINKKLEEIADLERLKWEEIYSNIKIPPLYKKILKDDR